jgi:hypothetical protein
MLCLNHVWELFHNLLEDEEFEGRADRIAKSPKFDRVILDRIAQIIGGTLEFNIEARS